MALEPCCGRDPYPILQMQPLNPGKAPAFGGLCVELILHIFSFLEIKERLRAAPTCRAFALLTEDEVSLKELIRTRLPQLKWIDEGLWREYVDLEHYGLSFEGVQRIPTLEKVKVLSSLLGEIEPQRVAGPGLVNKVSVGSPIVCMVLPGGLTVEKLIAIAAAPKKGTPVRSLKRCRSRKCIEKPYELLIGTNRLRCSALAPPHFRAGEALVAEAGCNAPRLLEVLALCLFERMRACESLPPLVNAMAYCSEKVKERHRFVIGSCPDVVGTDMPVFSDRFHQVTGFNDGLGIFLSKSEFFEDLLKPIEDRFLQCRITLGVLPVFRPLEID